MIKTEAIILIIDRGIFGSIVKLWTKIIQN